MDKVPPKIKDAIEENDVYEWIEDQDRLYSGDIENDTLRKENQFKFWQTNCEIRLAFKEIEQKINKSSKNVSTRIVGWSEIARRANCDRNSLKHSHRLSWVEERRSELLEKIKMKHIKVKGNNIQLVEEKDKHNELEITKGKLTLSKQESAKWFIKYQELQHELKMKNEALQRQLEANSMLNSEIRQLKKQIKQLMANNPT